MIKYPKHVHKLYRTMSRLTNQSHRAWGREVHASSNRQYERLGKKTTRLDALAFAAYKSLNQACPELFMEK